MRVPSFPQGVSAIDKASYFPCIYLRNIHLALTLKGLCINKLKDDEVLISNRKRTVRGRKGSMAIID